MSNNGTADWQLLTLGELTENHDSVRVPVKGSERRHGPYPYYGASGIVDYVDGFLFDGEYLLVAEDGENLRTRQTPVAFIATGKFWVNNHAHIVRGNEKANTRFLNYALSNADISGYLTGSTMPKLTQGNMNRIQLLTPPRHTQERIADILGSLDDKIELNRRMNATLEEMARRLFRSWFVDFDPVRAKAALRQKHPKWTNDRLSREALPKLDPKTAELFPDALEDSELGAIPKGWRAGRVTDLCAATGNGGTPKRDMPEYWDPPAIPWLTSGEVRQAIIINTNGFISELGLNKSAAKLWPTGTTVVALYGATAGESTLTAIPTSANQACCGLQPRPEFRHFLSLHVSRSTELLSRQARGSAQQNLSKQIVEDLATVVPADAIGSSFETVAEPYFDAWVLSLQESRDLAVARDRLLPRLLSGELSVTAAEESAKKVGG